MTEHLSIEDENNDDPKEQSLLDHLLELRKRLLFATAFFFLCFIVSYSFASEIYSFLAQPLAEILQKYTNQPQMIYTALWEGFLTEIKLAFYAAFFISMPFLLAQIWIFIAPGLYKTEKLAIFPFLIATPILFLMGGALVYYVIMPLAWDFFLSFQSVDPSNQVDIVLQAKIGEYLSLVIQFIFAFGLSFQLPVLMTLLARIGIVDTAFLKSKRKYAIVMIVAFAAIITPPDVISQIGLAIPIYLLYELSIFLAARMEKKRS